MKRFAWALTLLVLPVGAQDTPAPKCRFGKVELRRGPEEGGTQLLFRGRVIFEAGGESREVQRVLQGAGRDHLLLAIHSGGIACPTRFVIIDLEKSGRHRVSPEFGSCSPVVTARMRKDAVVAEMPLYTPHPELISERERKRRNRTKVVYTWQRGKLSHRETANR